MKTTVAKSVQNGIQKQVKGHAERTNSNALQSLYELFVDELKDIYWAEKAFLKTIPNMIKNATADQLVEALNDHLQVTKEHIIKLEEVFFSIGEKAETKRCEAMVGLINEAEDIIKVTEEGMIRDEGIISACQKIKHYEIATYGTLCSFANTLGESDAASLLYEILDHKKEIDKKLSEIAESMQLEIVDEYDQHADAAISAKAKRK